MEKPVPGFISLGESAIVVQWGNRVDRLLNRQVNALAKAIRMHPFAGLIDLIPAYSSLTISYDLCLIKQSIAKDALAKDYVQTQVQLLMQQSFYNEIENKTLIEIPVCYEQSLGNDLSGISKLTGLSIEQIIDLHSNNEYYVYMQGFLPGFAYMGEVNERIAVARKQQPVKVRAGAVGIAGRQTGIYPVDSPGGWQIVGYTPLLIFNSQQTLPCLINAGDMVKFVAISEAAYHTIKDKNPA